MVYKTLKKVSDVCQLLDKSKYPSVITNAGVTTTSNGDGSITINGTATASHYINCTPEYPKENNGHVLYVCANNTTMSNSTWQYGLLNQGNNLTDYGSGAIGITNALRERTTGIAFKKGVVFDNVIIKPQIIDLTEMYGAGNEPTTVEEFREKFPNELYDYKPYCFVKSYKTLLKASDNKIITSYKKSLVCKTKNLFDINSAEKYSGASSFSKNGNQITVSNTGIYGYVSANVLLDTSFVGKTVTFSAYAKTSDKNTAYLRIQWFTSNGIASNSLIASNIVSGQAYQKVSLTGIIPAQPDDEHNILSLSFYSNGPNGELPSKLYTAVYTDIQLELGDTATEYHPYGYL